MSLAIDMHVHTTWSPDAVHPESRLVRALRREDLDGVALTDHDRFDPDRIRRLNEEYDFQFIPAQEVTTSIGHLLAYFIDKPIEPHSDPTTVIDSVHDQGGLVFLAHPFRHKLSYSGDLWERIDGVERLNARSGDPADEASPNAKTVRAIEELSIPVTAGSDAHFPWEVGRARTVVRPEGGESIRSAIQEGRLETELNTPTGWPTKWLSELVWYGRLKGRLF